MNYVFIVLISISINLWIATDSLFIQAESDLNDDIQEDKLIKNAKKIRAIEKLMQVFGISSPYPEPQNKIPPQYMLDLYNSITDVDGVTRIPNPHHAKIIRSFRSSDESTATHFFFNIAGLEKDEYVLEAELHLFKKKSHANHESENEIYDVLLYQVTDDNLSNVTSQKLVGRHFVNSKSHGWMIFYVRVTVQEWLRNISSNKGFWVVTKKSQDSSPAPVEFVRHFSHSNAKQPLLVLFNNQNKDELAKIYSIDNIMEDDISIKSRAKRSIGYKNTECTRYDLFVDFAEIGWSSWIISPKGYNAYTCRGHCDFPLSQSQRPTNHATVQSIVFELSLQENVTKPCCVPSILLPISLLYFDDAGNVVIKQYDDMVAEECGCL